MLAPECLSQPDKHFFSTLWGKVARFKTNLSPLAGWICHWGHQAADWGWFAQIQELMQHGCVNLRLGSTAIGICTKEGVETLAIDYMHNDDATEVTELHQHLVPVYQHTPENHSAVVDDSQLWADMWCHLHGLAPISSIFKEVQGDLTRELRSFLWWRRGQPFCEIAILHLQNFGTCRTSMLWTKYLPQMCQRYPDVLCESLSQGDFSFGRPKLHREAARDRLPHGPEPSGHLQRMGITALRCLTSSYRVLSILHMFTSISTSYDKVVPWAVSLLMLELWWIMPEWKPRHLGCMTFQVAKTAALPMANGYFGMCKADQSRSKQHVFAAFMFILLSLWAGGADLFLNAAFSCNLKVWTRLWNVCFVAVFGRAGTLVHIQWTHAHWKQCECVGLNTTFAAEKTLENWNTVDYLFSYVLFMHQQRSGQKSIQISWFEAIADLALDFSDSDKKKKTMSRPFGAHASALQSHMSFCVWQVFT